MSRRASMRGRGGDGVPGRVRGLPRWLVALAVLTGFVAMHGMSADHDAHLLAGLPGHNAPAAQVAQVAQVAAGIVPAATPGVPAAQELPGHGGVAHPEDGCLVMLAISVMALLLASVAGRDAGVPWTAVPRPVLVVPTRRGPPGGAPCLFALGVLRT